MSKHDNLMLFGLPGDDSQEAAQRLDALLGITMRRTSRKAYFWHGEQGESIDLEYHEEEDEDGKSFLYPQYARFLLLLRVIDVADQDTYEKAILGDPELKAERLMRNVYKRGQDGKVITETYGPNGEVTVEVRPSRRKKSAETPGS